MLGDVVNTASRIEDEVAKPGEIVISGATYERVKKHVSVRPLGAKTLRGRTPPRSSTPSRGRRGRLPAFSATVL